MSVHLFFELSIGDLSLAAGHRAVPYDGFSVSLAVVHVSVHRVVAHAQAAAHEPEGRQLGRFFFSSKEMGLG